MDKNKKTLIILAIVALAFWGLFELGIFDKKKSSQNEQAAPEKINSVKLLLINEQTFRPGINNMGDIVAVFEGTHEFSETEAQSFDVITVKNISKQQAEEYLNSLLPDTSGLDDEQIRANFTNPKYLFRIVDRAQTDFSKMVITNRMRR